MSRKRLRISEVPANGKPKKPGLTPADVLVVASALLLPITILSIMASAEHIVYLVVDAKPGDVERPVVLGSQVAPRIVEEAARGLRRRYARLDAATLGKLLKVSSLGKDGSAMVGLSSGDLEQDRDVIAALAAAVARDRGEDVGPIEAVVREIHARPFGDQAPTVIGFSLAASGLCIAIVFGRLWYLRRKAAVGKSARLRE